MALTIMLLLIVIFFIIYALIAIRNSREIKNISDKLEIFCKRQKIIEEILQKDLKEFIEKFKK